MYKNISRWQNLSTPLVKKIKEIPKSRSRRSIRPKVSLALINACPLNVNNNVLETLCDYQEPVTSEQNRYDRNTSKQNYPKNSTSNLRDCSSKPFHPCYPDEKVFNAALELFNRQMERTNSKSSNGSQKWECKGKIRVSFQLCILCKDLGKVRSDMDTYYLNILEVRKYRTILCKGCLGYILHKHFGNTLSDIVTKLKELSIQN